MGWGFLVDDFFGAAFLGVDFLAATIFGVSFLGVAFLRVDFFGVPFLGAAAFLTGFVLTAIEDFLYEQIGGRVRGKMTIKDSFCSYLR